MRDSGPRSAKQFRDFSKGHCRIKEGVCPLPYEFARSAPNGSQRSLREAGPTLTHATPSSPKRAVHEVRDDIAIFRGPSMALTKPAIVSSSATPGTKTQSAPAVR